MIIIDEVAISRILSSPIVLLQASLNMPLHILQNKIERKQIAHVYSALTEQNESRTQTDVSFN